MTKVLTCSIQGKKGERERERERERGRKKEGWEKRLERGLCIVHLYLYSCLLISYFTRSAHCCNDYRGRGWGKSERGHGGSWGDWGERKWGDRGRRGKRSFRDTR